MADEIDSGMTLRLRKVFLLHGKGLMRFWKRLSREVKKRNVRLPDGKVKEVGNINYLLETFKGSYDKDKMKVTKNVFIMTVRRKIMESLAAQETHNATQLRLII